MAPCHAVTHAGPARGRGCVPGRGAGGQGEGKTQTRTARGKQRGATAAAGGSGRSPRAVGEPGSGLRPFVGVSARREKRDGAAPAPRDETTAGGTVPGSPGQFLPQPEGARGPPGPGLAALRSPPGPRPAGPPGAGEERGHGPPSPVPGSTAGAARAPHGLSPEVGAARPRAPCAPCAPAGPGPAAGSRGSARSRGRLRPGAGVRLRGKPPFRPFDPKCAPRPPDLRSPRPDSCDELLGAQRTAAGLSARLPPRFSPCRGFHGCELCNETRGLLPLPGPRVGAAGRARVSERG